MTNAIWALAMALALSPSSLQASIPNPDVPCWLGEGTNQSGFVSWDTRNGVRPYLITHDRDQFRDNGQLEEDYNFINYWFGEPAAPIQARHYLGSDEVSVILPGVAGKGVSLDEAKAAMPDGVLCYLQTRFAKVDVLTASGYEAVWKRNSADD
jgi:hypothetical protein